MQFWSVTANSDAFLGRPITGVPSTPAWPTVQPATDPSGAIESTLRSLQDLGRVKELSVLPSLKRETIRFALLGISRIGPETAAQSLLSKDFSKEGLALAPQRLRKAVEYLGYSLPGDEARAVCSELSAGAKERTHPMALFQVEARKQNRAEDQLLVMLIGMQMSFYDLATAASMADTLLKNA